ncbi:pro-FMRFamide-related neuropeptide VF [Betta splendens]|uniref:Pro-FMRFamide-related neuropeptide VF n=1 Tax=Betta splendens TaxID=158456 RepID=A0A6P7P0E5_BETSP|nr:pro-FMRFamide-related neuropeptide VF [Betta splendens]
MPLLTTVFLSALLMLEGAAAADLQVYRKSVRGDKSLPSGDDGRHPVRKQPQQQAKSGIRRSLDLESFNVHVTPTAGRINLPTLLRLYPPTAKPLHLHANMPMRFGRWSDAGDDRAPGSNPNMPQRFGRSWELTPPCPGCQRAREAPSPVLPQRFGRTLPYWGLLRTLASEQLLNTDLHWAEGFDFPTSSEEQDVEEEQEDEEEQVEGENM